jgi:hypothetical protein
VLLSQRPACSLENCQNFAHFRAASRAVTSEFSLSVDALALASRASAAASLAVICGARPLLLPLRPSIARSACTCICGGDVDIGWHCLTWSWDRHSCRYVHACTRHNVVLFYRRCPDKDRYADRWAAGQSSALHAATLRGCTPSYLCSGDFLVRADQVTAPRCRARAAATAAACCGRS